MSNPFEEHEKQKDLISNIVQELRDLEAQTELNKPQLAKTEIQKALGDHAARILGHLAKLHEFNGSTLNEIFRIKARLKEQDDKIAALQETIEGLNAQK